jgi:archaellum biogenesis protein FlaJ (TadC family)
MFRELELANWTQIIAIVAFVVSFGVFLFFLIGAIRMPKKKIKHDSELPLTEDHKKPRP